MIGSLALDLAAMPVRVEGLRRAQWASPDAIGDLQWRRTRRVLDHAARRSPFYRARFADLGLEHGDIRDRDHFARLPLTRREDVQADPMRLIADGYPRRVMRAAMSTGSTGRPTTTFFDPAAWILAKLLLKARARLACGVRPWDRVALLQEVERPPGLGLPLRTFSIHRPPAEILPDMLRYAPTILYGFPSHLLRLGEVASGRLRPRAIFTSSEVLDEVTRRTIERAFAAPVHDVYGCTEVKEVAWQCPERDGHHINADWLLVETVPYPGVAGDEDARIVVTSLYNFGAPLLRYEIGDTGALQHGRCACGRGLPLMRPAFGRIVDQIVLPGGAQISPYSLTCAMEQIEGIRRYQIVQTAAGRVEVRVVPGASFSASSREAVVRALRPVLHGLDAEVRTLDQLPPDPNGKFRVVKSELGRAARADGD